MIYRDNKNIANKYKSKKWQKFRHIYFLSVNGLCERCSKNGIIKSAEILHHIVYITDKNYQNDNIFYDTNNVEALCQNCHNKEHFAQKEEYVFDENGDLIKNEKAVI